MSNFTRTGALILALGLVLGLSALGYLLGSAALSVRSMERTVTVKGLSEREVEADVATWPLTFQVASNDLDEIYKTIESRSGVIRDFLIDYGIADEDIILSPPDVTDVYAQQWGDQSSVRFRYTGSGTVTVHSERVDAVRNAMANVLELGKKGVAIAGDHYSGYSSGRFQFTGLNDIKPEMVEEATRNARSVAEKFAEDSNSRLGKIKTASQGQFSITDRDSTTPHIKKVRVVSTIVYYLSD